MWVLGVWLRQRVRQTDADARSPPGLHGGGTRGAATCLTKGGTRPFDTRLPGRAPPQAAAGQQQQELEGRVSSAPYPILPSGWVLGPFFLPTPTTTFTKRRLYCRRFFARPVSFFFLSPLATFGV